MTRIGDKVRHVLAAPGDGRHHCHWPGCGVLVPPAKWGCRSHWYALPKDLRGRIWRAYRPGQEQDKRPSAEYLAAARAVQDWIAGRQPLRLL